MNPAVVSTVLASAEPLKVSAAFCPVTIEGVDVVKLAVG